MVMHQLTTIDFIDGNAREYLVKFPTQTRARTTFNRIVASAVQILIDEGLGCLNTNRVADAAGVNVATVYSYFTNKGAILFYLGKYYENARVDIVARMTAELSTDSDWRAQFEEIIDALVDFRISDPGCVVVRTALRALPEAPDFDTTSTLQAAEHLVDFIARLNPELDIDHIRDFTRFYSQTVTMVLDRAFVESPHNTADIAFLKEMTRSWLSQYLDGHIGSARVDSVDRT